MHSEQWKKEFITVPNLLSLFRIALIPVYISVYLEADSNSDYLLAGAVLAFSCLTDLADGIIARKLNQITSIGKILDPLADKLTQFALILSLSLRYPVLEPVLILFVGKELFQCGALIFFAQKGKALSGALWAGKLCTTALFVSLLLLVLFPRLPEKAVLFLTAADTVFLLYAFISYFLAYFVFRSHLTDLERNP